MRDAGIGRVLVAALHQAIADVLPIVSTSTRTGSMPKGLRDGTIGLAPLNAVLSFLRTEGVSLRGGDDAGPALTRPSGPSRSCSTPTALIVSVAGVPAPHARAADCAAAGAGSPTPAAAPSSASAAGSARSTSRARSSAACAIGRRTRSATSMPRRSAAVSSPSGRRGIGGRHRMPGGRVSVVPCGVAARWPAPSPRRGLDRLAGAPAA